MLLHVLGHVDAHHGLLVIEEELCQRARQFGFADAGWPQEDEACQWSMGVLQSGARTTNGVGDDLQGKLLAHDTLTQAVLHDEQLLYLGFHEPGDGNMRPLGDDIRDILGIYLFLEHTRTFEVGQLRLHLLNLSL